MQALRDAMSQIGKKADVFGISTDSVESHRGFAEKEHLNFPLLADADKKVSEEYGVLAPAGYAQRVTFVIGPDGLIREIDRTVNAEFDTSSGKLASHHGDSLMLLLSDWKAKIGGQVPNFSLPDASDKTVNLLTPGKKATVVLFLGTHCPVVKAYDSRMVQLASDPAYGSVSFLGINSNANETNAEVAAAATERHYPFVMAKDWRNRIADHFGASHTPEIWVIDAHGTAVYHGSIDDSQDSDHVTHPYLRDALDAVLAGRAVAVTNVRAVGCTIQRVRSARG